MMPTPLAVCACVRACCPGGRSSLLCAERRAFWCNTVLFDPCSFFAGKKSSPLSHARGTRGARNESGPRSPSPRNETSPLSPSLSLAPCLTVSTKIKPSFTRLSVFLEVMVSRQPACIWQLSSPGGRLCSGLPSGPASASRRQTSAAAHGSDSIYSGFFLCHRTKKCLVYRRAAVEQRHVCRNRSKPSRIYANGFNQRFFFQPRTVWTQYWKS